MARCGGPLRFDVLEELGAGEPAVVAALALRLLDEDGPLSADSVRVLTAALRFDFAGRSEFLRGMGEWLRLLLASGVGGVASLAAVCFEGALDFSGMGLIAAMVASPDDECARNALRLLLLRPILIAEVDVRLVVARVVRMEDHLEDAAEALVEIATALPRDEGLAVALQLAEAAAVLPFELRAAVCARLGEFPGVTEEMARALTAADEDDCLLG